MRGRTGHRKASTSREPLWAEKFGAEIEAYRCFTDTPPPVRVPALIAADEQHRVLLIAHAPGRLPVPGRDRFPLQALDPAHVTAMIEAMADLAQWRPPTDVLTRSPDYVGRLDRDHRQGLTTRQDHQALTDLLHQVGTDLVPGHGDPLPTNFVFGPDGRTTVIDWEHAGRYLPGHDLAVLWTVLANTEEARARIEELVAAGSTSARAAFTLNRAMLLVRELRNHRAVPPPPGGTSGWKRSIVTGRTSVSCSTPGDSTGGAGPRHSAPARPRLSASAAEHVQGVQGGFALAAEFAVNLYVVVVLTAVVTDVELSREVHSEHRTPAEGVRAVLEEQAG
ncbi:phosphotransferase family protein [Streptomyces aureus]